jgi:hypothetical protein
MTSSLSLRRCRGHRRSWRPSCRSGSGPWSGPSRRSRLARSLGHLHGVPTGALGERNRATALRCALPRSVRFEVHPITPEGREVGSTVAVVTADLRVLLSAVLEPPARGSTTRAPAARAGVLTAGLTARARSCCATSPTLPTARHGSSRKAASGTIAEPARAPRGNRVRRDDRRHRPAAESSCNARSARRPARPW